MSSDKRSKSLLTAHINQREDDYIMFTLKELDVINASLEASNITAKICMMLGSTLLGIALSAFIFPPDASPQLWGMIIIIFLCSLAFIAIGFFNENKSQTYLNRILKTHKNIEKND